MLSRGTICGEDRRRRWALCIWLCLAAEYNAGGLGRRIETVMSRPGGAEVAALRGNGTRGGCSYKCAAFHGEIEQVKGSVSMEAWSS